jgi:hypothetical protein
MPHVCLLEVAAWCEGGKNGGDGQKLIGGLSQLILDQWLRHKCWGSGGKLLWSSRRI